MKIRSGRTVLVSNPYGGNTIWNLTPRQLMLGVNKIRKTNKYEPRSLKDCLVEYIKRGDELRKSAEHFDSPGIGIVKTPAVVNKLKEEMRKIEKMKELDKKYYVNDHLLDVKNTKKEYPVPSDIKPIGVVPRQYGMSCSVAELNPKIEKFIVHKVNVRQHIKPISDIVGEYPVELSKKTVKLFVNDKEMTPYDIIELNVLDIIDRLDCPRELMDEIRTRDIVIIQIVENLKYLLKTDTSLQVVRYFIKKIYDGLMRQQEPGFINKIMSSPESYLRINDEVELRGLEISIPHDNRYRNKFVNAEEIIEDRRHKEEDIIFTLISKLKTYGVVGVCKSDVKEGQYSQILLKTPYASATFSMKAGESIKSGQVVVFDFKSGGVVPFKTNCSIGIDCRACIHKKLCVSKLDVRQKIASIVREVKQIG